VRVEGLDLEQPVVRVAVALQELEPAREALHRGEILLHADELAVDHVLGEVGAVLSLNCRSWYFSRNRSQCGCTIAFQASPSWPRMNSKES
jgi:hypothetical protein